MDAREEEVATIRAFLHKPRQERVLFLLAHKARRIDFTQELYHFKWLDERYAKLIDPKIAHTVDEIARMLRQKGAGETAYAISADIAIDGRRLPLEYALNYIWGREIGTILSCVPGKLGYFEDEEQSRLLER